MTMRLSEYAASTEVWGYETGAHSEGTCPECLAAWMRGEEHLVTVPVSWQTALYRQILANAPRMQDVPWTTISTLRVAD